MKAKLLIAAAVAVGIPSSALARNYYVVQNTVTHECSVLPKKPKGKSVVLVTGSVAYKTRTEARGALAALSACKK